MPQSYNSVILHVVFSTKYREPLIDDTLEQKLYAQIIEQLEKQKCIPIIINGMPDHIHILYYQNLQNSISDTIKQLKGASSFWVNNIYKSSFHFQWQRGYGVFSVSKLNLDTVYNYIKWQKRHHKTK